MLLQEHSPYVLDLFLDPLAFSFFVVLFTELELLLYGVVLHIFIEVLL